MAVAWNRLIRFVATDGRILRGEPILPSPDFDLGNTTAETQLKALIISDHDLYDTTGATEVTNEVAIVKELLGPLAQTDVPILRCVGLNYAKHIKEANRSAPPFPFIFFKPITTVTDHNVNVVIPKICQDDQADYEGELCIVIGRDVKDVSEADALDYVAAYTCGNDISSRKLQRDAAYAGRIPQWGFSKGFDTFAPLGPCLVSSKLIDDPAKLHLKTTVDGEMKSDDIVPLIIDGLDVTTDVEFVFETNRFGGKPSPKKAFAQGASTETCLRAVESCAKAFPSWKRTDADQKRKLFQQLKHLLEVRGDDVREIIEEEINCSKLWSHINLQDSLGLIDEAAALVTSDALSGTIPITRNHNAPALVFKEPMGVILGIAPWNAPLILGFRAVVAPIAAGNTAILKGSELSPRVHYFIAQLFQDAGFPPGVLNFIMHRPQEASAAYETMISHPAVRKCNFTGSTPVGRLIASRAAASLKPVLLELGGKNFAIILDDADLDKSARLTLEGAFLNNGQICMSTDTVLVSRSVFAAYRKKLIVLMKKASSDISAVITTKSSERLRALINDAIAKGADITTGDDTDPSIIPATIVDNMIPSMDFYHAESFGPMLGLQIFDDISEATKVINDCPFGLSSAIFTRNHYRAMMIAKDLNVGAIHINGATVHDEPTIPHGGHGDSGWGRFGGSWGLDEFVHTKTIILNE
ncbi:hypothetical protein V499_02212 [Pseudogymnoascus sp. VKM F-103]|nr:hypothetical protein V499_02212 [Pseudogymnoascus sp. VKM F-103]